MSGTPKIKPVSSSKEKGKTYKELIETYHKAMEEGFYGEAELIVYAFMEDRLRAFLYHCNAIDRRNSRYINENMQAIYGECVSTTGLQLKLDVIEKALGLVSKNEIQTDYSRELAEIFRIGLDIREFKKKIRRIRKWCSYRNEIVHAMFHKDIEDLRSGFKEHVEEGFGYARFLDKQVAALKKV